VEIRSLSLVVSEHDLNYLLSKLFIPPARVQDLRISVIPGGLLVTGIYQTIFRIHFQSLWQIDVSGGRIAARLSSVKAVGLRLKFLKTYVLNAISSKTNLLELRDETLLLDVDRVLAVAGAPLRTNLVTVRCHRGQLEIECGTSLEQ
jgi:hypothetical protein